MDVDQLFSVSGKSVVVTGGSRGIGYMIAEGFVRAGARVIITARKIEACHEAAERLSAYGECVSMPSDLASEDGRAGFADAVRDRFDDTLHVLVNNAGATWGAPLDEFPQAGWDKVLDVNVKGLGDLTRLLLPALRRAASNADPARVINIGSIDGLRVPAMENYSYSASKAAVHMLTRHLATRLAADQAGEDDRQTRRRVDAGQQMTGLRVLHLEHRRRHRDRDLDGEKRTDQVQDAGEQHGGLGLESTGGD